MNVRPISSVLRPREIANSVTFRSGQAGNLGMKQEFDISYYNKYPLNVLCNFMPSNFNFDGITITSMEGFLQSLKVNDVELQKRICRLAAPHAKRVGSYLKKSGQFDGTHLYWQGKEFNRHSGEYQELLDRVYSTKFRADEDFRNMLMQTQNYNLVHKVGKTGEEETILTESEFIHHLVTLRTSKGRDFSKRHRNISKSRNLEIPRYCRGINMRRIENTDISALRAYNDRMVCGKEVLGSLQEKKLKEAGVAGVIDLYNGSPSTKSFYKSELKHYCFPINEPESRMEELAEKLPGFIKFMNTENSYIFCKSRLNEANTALAINYLFNPKSMLSESILWGQLEPDDILLKKMDRLCSVLSKETKEQLGWGNNFEEEFEKRRNILTEMNTARMA